MIFQQITKIQKSSSVSVRDNNIVILDLLLHKQFYNNYG